MMPKRIAFVGFANELICVGQAGDGELRAAQFLTLKKVFGGEDGLLLVGEAVVEEGVFEMEFHAKRKLNGMPLAYVSYSKKRPAASGVYCLGSPDMALSSFSLSDSSFSRPVKRA
jgi:hypothetical protein